MTCKNTICSTLLEVRGLSISFNSLPVVKDVNFNLSAGEVLAIVGESGSGKSLSMLALLGLIESPGFVKAERIYFNGIDLLNVSARQRRCILGNEIGVVFQDALSSLNPSYPIGVQIAEMLRIHKGIRGSILKKQVLALLDKVGIPDARNRFGAYPHQLSGGMNQRVLIAMAIACEPKLLIADEPTTALDVTIQSQVMQLLRTLQKEQNMALILISHDLGVVAEVADRVVVMYAGEAIENNTIPEIFEAPRHPYTAALLAATPEHNRHNKRLFSLPGTVPNADVQLSGCLFAPRCQYSDKLCFRRHPELGWPARSIHFTKHLSRKTQSFREKKSNEDCEKKRNDSQFTVEPISWVRCIRQLNESSYDCIQKNKILKCKRRQ